MVVSNRTQDKGDLLQAVFALPPSRRRSPARRQVATDQSDELDRRRPHLQVREDHRGCAASRMASHQDASGDSDGFFSARRLSIDRILHRSHASQPVQQRLTPYW
jgi:hypothetical protein